MSDRDRPDLGPANITRQEPAPKSASPPTAYPRSSPPQAGPRPPTFGPCKYFLKGACTKGETCPYPHPVLQTQAHGERKEPVSNPASLHQPEAKVNEDKELTASPNDQAEAPDKPTSETSDSGSTTERKKFGCRVVYGDGSSVRQVVTAFESQYVILSKFPPSATYDDLATLAETSGNLESLTLDKQADGLRIARLKYVSTQDAINAVRDLNGAFFRSYSLAARFDIRAVEDGASVLRSTKVKVSWYAPSSMAWAHYRELSFARLQAEKLNGATFNGRKISASFQAPTPTYYARGRLRRPPANPTIHLKSLPPHVSSNQLKDFCRADSINLGDSNYEPDDAIQEIRSILSQLATLEAFESLPLDPGKPKMMAFAQFTTPDAAEHAIKQFHGVPQDFLKGGPIWMELIHSIKYTIPLALFKIIKAEMDTLRDNQDSCKFRYYEADTAGATLDPVVARIYSPEPKALGKIKTTMESIMRGELFLDQGKEVWDDYFATPEAVSFVKTVCETTSAFVKCDTRLRTLQLYGAPRNKVAARQALSRKIAEVAERKHIVHIDKAELRALVSGRFQSLVDRFGAEKVVLDVARRTILIRAESNDVDIIRKAITDVSTGSALGETTPQSDQECPVCFCETTDPIKLGCGHQYCTSCLQHLLCSSPSSNITSMKCVSEAQASGDNKHTKHCDVDIPYAIIRSLLSPGEEDRLLEATFLSYIHSRPNEFRYCPTPDCQIIYRAQKDGSVLRCPSCLARICASCHVEFHEGQVCAEYKDQKSGGNEAFQKWKEQNGVKSCPTCKADMEKAGGCNHMTCVRCGTHMCWVCMKTFSNIDSGGGVYDHMRKAHGGIGI